LQIYWVPASLLGTP